MKNGKIVDEYGHVYYYANGKLHREDGPAVELSNGDKWWYVNNKLHRLDGPAIEYANGDKSYYVNGKYHREDGPAVIYANSRKEWWFINDQPCTEEQIAEIKFNMKLNKAFKEQFESKLG